MQLDTCSLLKNCLLFITCNLVLISCGTLENGHSWGEDTSLFPSTHRLSQAATISAQHPATWAPLLGATLFSIANLDEDISRRLADNNPVFGSKQEANDASDLLRDSLVASVVVSALATPGGDTASEQFTNKSKGLITEFAALEITAVATSQIKRASGRERPNAINNSSFPSGHTSRAFAAAALTSKNLDSLSLTSGTATGIRVGLYTFAAGTALARVEAEMHYTTDVMVGAALGNFLSRFIHDAFLGLDNNNQIQLNIAPKFTSAQLKLVF